MSIYFVDPAKGADTNNGLTENTPFRSIAHAIQALRPGDTLRLHAGSVYGPTTGFPPNMSGTSAAPILVEPYAGSRVIFDGRLRLPDLAKVPNTEWEPVPGHPGEWRSPIILTKRRDGPVLFGAFLDTALRLIRYSRIEDLRAMNESFHRVPLSDPRLAGGPLVGDPSRKIPWMYLGPGLHWVLENPTDPADTTGRVHVRFSPTHLQAPGTQDYTGPSDPNQIPLALTPENWITVGVEASHVRFRNLVIRNGGLTTLQVKEAHDVTFDHCEIHGAQYGVRIDGDSTCVTFRHCTFDGALAPWTTRSDVKNTYKFVDPVLGQAVTNSIGVGTHEILVISGGNGVEFDHCTFRRAHDGLQITGNNTEVHHCLFQDINDEALQFLNAPNTHVWRNVIRQALHAFSILKDNRLAGSIFIYRNIIDQRLPTRGYRTLPPDAPAPYIWRYGAGFKIDDEPPLPRLHVYHNTFIASHPDDKGSALTVLFYGNNSPDIPRIHLNNLLVGLHLNLPYSWAMPTSSNRRSEGNLWHEPHADGTLLFQFIHPDRPKDVVPVRTIAQLRQLDSKWEHGSVFAEPKLCNLDDEIFGQGPYLGENYPNNDFRPAPGSPAIAAGVELPRDLNDPDRPSGGARPDIGALPAASSPLGVGVDESLVFPAAGVPIARAGPDQLLLDTDGDGFEPVTIDGTHSAGEGSEIASYEWMLDGKTVASKASATLYLPEGDHYLRLIVTNGAGNTDTDGMRIQIRPPAPHGDNALRDSGFEKGGDGWDIVSASIVTSPVHSGRRAVKMVPQQQPSVRQRVPVSPETKYRISAWVRGTPATTPPITVRAAFDDTQGTPLQTTQLSFTTDANYAYREGTVVAPQKAVVMTVSLGFDVTAGAPAFIDDVRVLDANLLTNSGFETPAPTGSDREAPGWTFVHRGQLEDVRVISDPANVRSGARAVALQGHVNNYRQVTQTVPALAGVQRYRVSGWVRTDGLTVAPKIILHFEPGGDRTVAQTISEGAYRFVSLELLAPVSTVKSLTARLHLDKGSAGTAYFDDLLIEPL